MNKTWLIAGISFAALTLGAANIILVGDSTMADYSDQVKNFKPSRPRYGWGEMLQQYCRDGVAVFDEAIPGESSRRFLEKGYWEKALALVQKGDFVIIQFCHNDGSKKYLKGSAYSDPETFTANIRQMISDTKKAGATAIVLSSTVCCENTEEQTLKQKSYGEAGLLAAKIEQVEFVDIRSLMTAKLAAMDKLEKQKLFMIFAPGEDPNFPDGLDDKIHLRQAGAELVASIFVDAAKKDKLSISKLFK